MERRIVNFGSLNIDHVYKVDRITRPGESQISGSYARFAGGKGANQSVAIARAGCPVVHVGKIGQEGRWMLRDMEADGVDISRVSVSDEPGGHAIIQVDREGQNSIVVFGGTNQQITESEIDRVFAGLREGDLILLQNEINNIPYILQEAAARSLPIYFNAAPMTAGVVDYPLQLIDTFFINETEGKDLTQKEAEEQVLREMERLYPSSHVVITLGERGVLYGRAGERIRKAVRRNVRVVDTTGAGDTFVGYYMAALCLGKGIPEALAMANLAAALCVTKAGAAASIPRIAGLEDMSKEEDKLS